MKNTVLALAVLGVAYVSAQTEPWCRCALFVSGGHAEYMVSELPEVEINDCESHDQCKYRCRREFNDMTNEMDLWSTVNNATVGSYLCQNLEHSIHNKYVYGYYEMCGGPWEYSGLVSQQMLCCYKGEHNHCISM
nr:uncharacterized protein LOC113819428 [Penaeus vannamei]